MMDQSNSIIFRSLIHDNDPLITSYQINVWLLLFFIIDELGMDTATTIT